MKQKSISIILAAALLAACLAGCGSKETKVEVVETAAPQETAAPAPETTETPEATPAPEETDAPEETPDPEELARRARYQAAYEKFAPDRTVMLVGERAVCWADYFSWLYDITTMMESNYGVTDWNEPRDELQGMVGDATFGTYARLIALDYVTQIETIEQKAEEMGVVLSEAQQAEIQDTLDGYAEYLGGQEEMERYLSDSYLSMEYFTRQNEDLLLINNIYEKLYGEKGSNLSEEDAVNWLKDNGYLYAKHILFRTVDDSSNPLSEEEIAQKKAEAEKVLGELRACPPEQLTERFDALMKQYSEDTGLLSYPDGYYFQTGEMVPVFESAVRELEGEGLYPELVESDYGYHIIFCPPMQGTHIMGYDNSYASYDARAYASAALFDNILREWYTQAEWSVQYVDGFDELDLNELFGV